MGSDLTRVTLQGWVKTRVRVRPESETHRDLSPPGLCPNPPS